MQACSSVRGRQAATHHQAAGPREQHDAATEASARQPPAAPALCVLPREACTADICAMLQQRSKTRKVSGTAKVLGQQVQLHELWNLVWQYGGPTEVTQVVGLMVAFCRRSMRPSVEHGTAEQRLERHFLDSVEPVLLQCSAKVCPALTHTETTACKVCTRH